jgi:hypothetical protein
MFGRNSCQSGGVQDWLDCEILRVAALTIDGSPHCIQLHFLIEDIKRHFTPEVETDHYVVEKGNVHQVSAAAVKRARHLSKIALYKIHACGFLMRGSMNPACLRYLRYVSP